MYMLKKRKSEAEKMGIRPKRHYCAVCIIFSKTPQDIRSSARRIFDAVAVATARKSNAADGRIDKEI